MISNWYKVSKTRVGKNANAVRKALTILPKVSPGEEVIPMHIYRETDSEFWVPVNWGIANFGDAERQQTQGNPAVYEKFPDPNHVNAPEGQARFMDDVLNACNTHRQFIAEAGTGTGKTVVGLNTIAKMGIEGLVVVPTDRLVRQWKEQAIDKLGLTEDQIGTVKQDVCDYEGKHITIASMQSLECHEYPPEFYSYHGIVLIDEAHKVAAQKMSSVFGLFHAAIQICLTATLKRRDGRHRVVTLWYGNPVVRAIGMQPLPLIVIPFEYKHEKAKRTVISGLNNVLPVLDKAHLFEQHFGISITADKSGLIITGKDLSDLRTRKPIFQAIDRVLGFNYPYCESYFKIEDRYGTRNAAIQYLARNKERNLHMAGIIKAAYGKGSVLLGISDSVRQLQSMQKYLLADGVPEEDVCIFADQLYLGEKRLSIKMFEGFDLPNFKANKKDMERIFNLKVNASVKSLSISGKRLGRQSFRNDVVETVASLGGVSPVEVNAHLSVLEKKVKQSSFAIDAMLSDESMRIYLATYGVMELGIDVPWIDIGIDLTPRATGVQVAGRVRRRYGGKQVSRWLTPKDYGLSRTIEGINDARIRDYATTENVLIERMR